jgi:hypothetical protein
MNVDFFQTVKTGRRMVINQKYLNKGFKEYSYI